ncbi:MAG: recB [Myxococcaceae bacterium]|nr:recB [Myxococcaceae bacterium]
MQVLDPALLELRGTAIVEASAGTGKTYTITSLFLRLLLENELTVDQILVVTYTRAATAELRDRIRKRIAQALDVAKGEPSEDAFVRALCDQSALADGRPALVERLERALAGVDEAPVLTIHGFCQRVLRDHAFESGSAFEAELTAHAGPLLDEIADDYFMRELYQTSPLRAAVLLDEPEQLRELAARVSGRGMRMLPEHVEELGFDHAEWSALLESCRSVWRSERDAIVERVRGLKGVGGKVVSYAALADVLLADGDAKELLDKTSFANFTSTGVRAKGKPDAGDEHPFFALADRLLDGARALRRSKTSIELSFRRRFVDYLESELTRRTRETSVRTFDALLGDLDKALGGPSGPLLVERLRSKYRAALVDEFQDTDPTQYRIFRRIFADSTTPLLLIGDPKQAIYGFRGADVAAYLGARRAAGDRVYTLDVNYRSDAALIDALNAMYARVERPFLLPEIAYQQVRAASGTGERLRARDERAPLDLALVRVEDSSADAVRRQIARYVASDIAALLASPTSLCARAAGSASSSEGGARFRPLAAADVAVLCRTNKEAALVQLALSERGVPSVLSGDASVFDSDDVPQLERALTALAHPTDPRALRSFLASLYGGYDAARICELESDDVLWEEHRARFQRLHETWLSHGFMQALRGLTAAYQVEHRLLQRADGTRRITNLWHLAELLAEAALSERLGPLGLLRWLALVQRDAALRSELVGDAHELRLESSEDAVTLTTVHKSKGLEYPLVYCPFLWDAVNLRKGEKQFVRFHDPAEDNALTLDLGSEHSKTYQEIASKEAMQEALRLLYVALTRAKHRVTVVLPNTKSLTQSALAYTLFGGGDPAERQGQVGALLEADHLQRELTTLGFGARALAPVASPRYVSRSSQTLSAGARPIRRPLDRSYRVASFSALVAKERSSLGEAGIDRDALTASATPDGPLMAEAPSPLTLGAFPRGAVAGQLVHEVLEHTLFDGGVEDLELVAQKLVRERGYAAELAPTLAHGLWETLHTPLDPDGLMLAQLSRSARIDEMEFVFPVDSLLTPRVLERAFRAHKAPPALPSYASELRELGFDALHGYLRGFIDLVFRHEGRFYIVDYKSNWLGPVAADYEAEQLARAMADHHYYLQYHLYTVALHRYLSHRLPGYDYATHFGGVYYLFLRGMAPAHPARTGVYFDRPSAALVEALDAALRSARVEEATP